MAVATVRREMARRDDTAVKIDSKVAQKAKVIAASKDMSLAEYLTILLEPLVERDLREFARKALDEPKPRGSK